MKPPRPAALRTLALPLALLLCAPLVPRSEARAEATTGAAAALASHPAIGQVLRVSVGADRSVATVATLRSPDAGEAVFWQRGEAATIVVRTGEPVPDADGGSFELRAIGRAWAAPDALLYLGTTREGPPVLVRHDAAGSRVLAVGADPAGTLLTRDARPVVGSAGCSLELEVFELLAAGATPLQADGSVRFPAWLGAPCDGVQASVRYREGHYSIESLTAEPAAAAGAAPDAAADRIGPWRLPEDGRIDLADGE